MSDESDNYEFEEEIDARIHDGLIETVLNLNKKQTVKKPCGTVSLLNITPLNQTNQTKNVVGDKESSSNAMPNVCKSCKKHNILSKKGQLSRNKTNTVPAPLEKPQADCIERSVNYEKSRLQLDNWEALVTSNRVATQLVFPLNSTEKINIEEKKSEVYPTTWRIKSELQIELEKIQSKVEEYHINEVKDNFLLTLKEVQESRKEAAKLRAHQSYKEAKARQQNKIKSKKYHRILKREKIKQKLKEFEELQKTNPEEALKKLEDIEKARAEERFSLRHKGTGQWARNKQIRAKYDKESRQVLAQQLAISRDLTQKMKNIESDSDEDITLEQKANHYKENGDNPWVSGMKPSKEIVDFVSGYKKYWNEKKNGPENHDDNRFESDKDQNDQKLVQENETGMQTYEEKETELQSLQNEEKVTNRLKKKISAPSKKYSLKTSESDISYIKDGDDVEDMFNKLEQKLQEKVKKKYKEVRNKTNKKKGKTTNKKLKNQKIDLSMPQKILKPIINEQMIEEQANSNVGNESLSDKNPNSSINDLKNILDSAKQQDKTDIDPHKFIQVKTTKLNTAIPDILTTDENEENNNQRDVILEAFEDDDIAEEFKKEKEDEMKKDTPGDIDLNLPGWGNWGGTNIVHSKKRKRRFIIKMPKKMPRRDDNKGSLIINEKAQSAVKPHMVSEVPFPFRTVKDYEASMRAPIGNTFVPETAYRKFIEPSVITKMGAIIEPISKSVLIGEK